MTRRRSLVAAVALALLAVSCSSSGGGAGSAGSSGLFKWGTTSPIDSLNPFVAVQQNAYYTFEYVYPFLVQYGPGLQVVPDFAKSWQVTDGGRTITFTTRSGARWSDGRPLTAQDAAWTINTVVKYQSGPAASQAGAVTDVTGASAPNATTLVVHYRQPAPDALPALQKKLIAIRREGQTLDDRREDANLRKILRPRILFVAALLAKRRDEILILGQAFQQADVTIDADLQREYAAGKEDRRDKRNDWKPVGDFHLDPFRWTARTFASGLCHRCATLKCDRAQLHRHANCRECWWVEQSLLSR